MPIPKQDGDTCSATVTFNYKGPASYYNVGVIVETKPNVFYIMQEHYCGDTGGAWVGQSVSVGPKPYNASWLDHGDLVDCVKVIYASGQAPAPGGDGSLFKDSDPNTYVHQSEGEFKDLYAQYS